MEMEPEDRRANGRGPDPEVVARPRRRTFTAKYKLRILEEVDAAEAGGIGAILRREGLYSSRVSQWREERRRGTLAALSKTRGRKPTKNPLSSEVERLRRELAKTQQKLAQAEVIIDVQKKVASLLGIPLKSLDDEGSAS
jgi:transposase-like protein